MITYRIGVLLLIKCLKSAYSGVTQTSYSDNAGTLGTFDNLVRYFNLLKRNVPDQGYYPNPNKSVIVVHLNNIKLGELFYASHRFRVCTGACYIGGYIMDDKSKGNCITKRIENW